MNTIEIIIVIISSISLVLTLLVLFLVFKNKSKDNLSSDLKELGAISQQLENLSKQLKGDVELAVTKEVAKINEASINVNEKNNEKLERFQTNITESLNKRFDSLNEQFDKKMTEINKKVDDRLSEGFKTTSETITQVRERLQAIDDAQKNIENLSKDVVSLKNVLEGNQTRGQYGEYQLSMVLHNVFGDTTGCYEEQFTMKKTKDGNDVRADAVVFMPKPNQMICIDSKFPFQDYAKALDAESEEEKEKLTKEFGAAVKKHITAIKDKYIVDGKTAPEAIMFIPNDGVFAFIHHNLEEIVEYARNQRVILTSPSTLPAILVTINMVRIEYERSKNVKIITKQLSQLGHQFKMFSSEWESFSNQLEKATRNREKLNSRVDKITGKFEAISGNAVEEEEELKEIDITDD